MREGVAAQDTRLARTAAVLLLAATGIRSLAAVIAGFVEWHESTAAGFSGRFRAADVLTVFGSAGDGIRGQALVASLCSAVTAYFSVRFLMRYFETRTLIPFAIWCLVFGAACSIYFLAT